MPIKKPLVKEYMTSDVVTIDVHSNRDDILKIFKRTGVSGMPVLNNKDLIGIITRKDILRKKEETQVALIMTETPIVTSSNTPIAEAAQIIIDNNIRRLPVVDNNKLVGILSVADLVGAVAKSNDQREIKSKFINKNNIFAIWEETPLPVVGRVMELAGVYAIPILNSENQLTGIISERDLIRSAKIEDGVKTLDFSMNTDDEWTWESIRDNYTLSYGVSKVELPNKPVKDFMIKNIVSITQNTDVSTCALKMKRGHLDQLPIINNEQIFTGMIFDRDIIKAIYT